MDYMKLFDTHSEYEEFISRGEVTTPNVSHCVQENDVHYNAIAQQNAIDKLLNLLELDSIEDLALWSYGSWLYAGEGHANGEEIIIVDNSLYYYISNVNSRMGEVQFVSTDWEIDEDYSQQQTSSNLLFTPEEWDELSEIFQTNNMTVFIAAD